MRFNGIKGIWIDDKGQYRWSVTYKGAVRGGTACSIADAKQARGEAKEAMEAEYKMKNPTARDPKYSQARPTLYDAIDAMRKTDWSQAKSLKTININCDIVLQFFDNKAMADITTQDIEEFIDWLRKRGNKGSSINRKLAILSKLLTRSYDKGIIDRKPFIERQPESSHRIRFLSRDEETQVLELLESWKEDRFAHVVRVLLDTGIRVGELRKLSQDDILEEQGHHGVVLLHDTKNGESRSVPLTARAAESLQYLARTSKSRESLISEYCSWITKTWNRARKALGYAKDPHFIPHILRHTCCSRLVQKGAPLKKVQVWLGHKTISTTMRYAHLCPEDIYDLTKLL